MMSDTPDAAGPSSADSTPPSQPLPSAPPPGSFPPPPPRPPSGGENEPWLKKRLPLWLTIVALIVGAAVGAAIGAASTETTTAAAPSTETTRTTESQAPKTSTSTTVKTTTTRAPTTTAAPRMDLQIESGMSTGVDSIGTRYTTAGAVVTNPNTALAAYGVHVVFNLVDAAGTVTDTDTTNVDYIPGGGRALVAPLQIGFDSPSEPARVDVTAVVDTWARDTGYHADFSMFEGVALQIAGAAIARTDYSASVKGQVTNPSTSLIDNASVTCVIRAGGALVGGSVTYVTDPIASGATIAFEVSFSHMPDAADSTECQGLG